MEAVVGMRVTSLETAWEFASAATVARPVRLYFSHVPLHEAEEIVALAEQLTGEGRGVVNRAFLLRRLRGVYGDLEKLSGDLATLSIQPLHRGARDSVVRRSWPLLHHARDVEGAFYDMQVRPVANALRRFAEHQRRRTKSYAWLAQNAVKLSTDVELLRRSVVELPFGPLGPHRAMTGAAHAEDAVPGAAIAEGAVAGDADAEDAVPGAAIGAVAGAADAEDAVAECGGGVRSR
ncbi:hypothetical protein ACP4OV_018530 [Aristida adscensionis]